MIPIISFVGYHNSGKTTLILSIITEIMSKGISVGVIKHDPKGKAIIDEGAKDSARFYKAGVEKVAIISANFAAIKIRGDQRLEKIAELIENVDIIIAEGFKSNNSVPKIWVERNENEEVNLNGISPIIATIGKQRYDDKKVNWKYPYYNRDQIADITDFILESLSITLETAPYFV